VAVAEDLRKPILSVRFFAIIVLLGVLLVRLPLANAGRPEEPAPPSAMM